MSKKYILLLIVTIIVVISIVTTIVLLSIGAFASVYDYKAVAGGEDGEYSRKYLQLIEQMESWTQIEIDYNQLYTDGQYIKNKMISNNGNINTMQLWHETVVSGDNGYCITSIYDKGIYSIKKKINSSENSEFQTENITENQRFFEIKNELVGNYMQYLKAFERNMLERLYLRKDGDVYYLKVVFDKIQSKAVMGEYANKLEMIACIQGGKLSSLTMKYTLTAQSTNDCDSSVIISFIASDYNLDSIINDNK